ncbi:MAG: 3'-5' exonuclease [Bacteroidia bacterium]|nr:3'-5' exonuclease [Bacteroidia bacterium]
MEFNLDRDIVFFDIESTGLNVIRDRILQIALIKYFKNGKEPEELEMLINPGIPISEEAMEVHGITPDKLRNKPVFSQVAQKLYEFIGNADLGGYNSNRFDIPMLIEEFHRVGIQLDMTGRRTIDVQRIFYKMEPRTLAAAYKFYCDQEIINAHDALSDVKATVDVLKGQLDRYTDMPDKIVEGETLVQGIKNDMRFLHEFTTDSRMIDGTQRLKYNKNGIIVFNFGKYAEKPVAETLFKDRQYFNWMLNMEFSAQVKQKIKELVKEYEQRTKDNF